MTCSRLNCTFLYLYLHHYERTHEIENCNLVTKLRSKLFRATMQRIVVIPCHSSEQPIDSFFKGQEYFIVEDKLSRNFGTELPLHAA